MKDEKKEKIEISQELSDKMWRNSLAIYNKLVEKIFDGTITDTEKGRFKMVEKKLGLGAGVFYYDKKYTPEIPSKKE